MAGRWLPVVFVLHDGMHVHYFNLAKHQTDASQQDCKVEQLIRFLPLIRGDNASFGKAVVCRK
jgi:hypothetical protein